MNKKLAYLLARNRALESERDVLLLALKLSGVKLRPLPPVRISSVPRKFSIDQRVTLS